MSKHVALVVTGAPLAVRTPEIAAAILEAGRTVTVVATHAAMSWVDHLAVKQATGHDVFVDYRKPGEPKRGPEADSVIVCPATFNTLNKVAAGLADNYACGLVCEAIGQALPVTIVPMINDWLWRHPACSSSFGVLERVGVTFVDVLTGKAGRQPVRSGTGDEVVRQFEPTWISTLLRD
jgi:phosphopantothenoylcysteine synthetase/decarboxylase